MHVSPVELADWHLALEANGCERYTDATSSVKGIARSLNGAHARAGHRLHDLNTRESPEIFVNRMIATEQRHEDGCRFNVYGVLAIYRFDGACVAPCCRVWSHR